MASFHDALQDISETCDYAQDNANRSTKGTETCATQQNPRLEK